MITEELPKRAADPKKIEQGRRLAEYNRRRRQEIKELEEKVKIQEEQEFEPSLSKYEQWKHGKETLTTQSPEEKKSKMPVFLPVLVLTVIGAGTFWYYHKPKKNESPKKSERPKILSRFERF